MLGFYYVQNVILTKHCRGQMNKFPFKYCYATSSSTAKEGLQHKHKAQEIQALIYKISLFFCSLKGKKQFEVSNLDTHKFRSLSVLLVFLATIYKTVQPCLFHPPISTSHYQIKHLKVPFLVRLQLCVLKCPFTYRNKPTEFLYNSFLFFYRFSTRSNVTTLYLPALI